MVRTWENGAPTVWQQDSCRNGIVIVYAHKIQRLNSILESVFIFEAGEDDN